MTAQYLLCPGMVTSQSDGERHYITASKLAMLYRVRLDECVILPAAMPSNHRRRTELLDRARKGELIGLAPREDGNYER